MLKIRSYPLDVQRTAVWTVKNLCRGKPSPSLRTVVKVIVPFITLLKETTDYETMIDVLWTLSYTTEMHEMQTGQEKQEEQDEQDEQDEDEDDDGDELYGSGNDKNRGHRNQQTAGGNEEATKSGSSPALTQEMIERKLHDAKPQSQPQPPIDPLQMIMHMASSEATLINEGEEDAGDDHGDHGNHGNNGALQNANAVRVSFKTHAQPKAFAHAQAYHGKVPMRAQSIVAYDQDPMQGGLPPPPPPAVSRNSSTEHQQKRSSWKQIGHEWNNIMKQIQTSDSRLLMSIQEQAQEGIIAGHKHAQSSSSVAMKAMKAISAGSVEGQSSPEPPADAPNAPNVPNVPNPEVHVIDVVIKKGNEKNNGGSLADIGMGMDMTMMMMMMDKEQREQGKPRKDTSADARRRETMSKGERGELSRRRTIQSNSNMDSKTILRALKNRMSKSLTLPNNVLSWTAMDTAMWLLMRFVHIESIDMIACNFVTEQVAGALLTNLYKDLLKHEMNVTSEAHCEDIMKAIQEIKDNNNTYHFTQCKDYFEMQVHNVSRMEVPWQVPVSTWNIYHTAAWMKHALKARDEVIASFIAHGVSGSDLLQIEQSGSEKLNQLGVSLFEEQMAILQGIRALSKMKPSNSHSIMAQCSTNSSSTSSASSSSSNVQYLHEICVPSHVPLQDWNQFHVARYLKDTLHEDSSMSNEHVHKYVQAFVQSGINGYAVLSSMIDLKSLEHTLHITNVVHRMKIMKAISTLKATAKHDTFRVSGFSGSVSDSDIHNKPIAMWTCVDVQTWMKHCFKHWDDMFMYAQKVIQFNVNGKVLLTNIDNKAIKNVLGIHNHTYRKQFKHALKHLKRTHAQQTYQR